MSLTSLAPAVDEESPAFGRLSDLIADGDLVAITGAGISAGLKRAAGDDGVPGWKELLQRIHSVVRASMSSDENTEIDQILALKYVPTQCLIEIATKLREADSGMYEELLRQVTPLRGQYSNTHKALTNLQPRGIVTFNYDDCHESAYEASDGKSPVVLTPYSEPELISHLSTRLREPFILKAHGSVHDSKGPLVLDWGSYRALLAKEPTYRAFFQNILTNFNCLFVGFGLSDPDFDMFVDVIASTYGSPVSEHVAIRHVDSMSAEEFVWKRRYGIHCLHVSDYGKIPGLVTKASQSSGPKLKRWLDAALSTNMEDRQSAHEYFRQLGMLGRRCASESLKTNLESETGEFRISEMIFSLGVIPRRKTKKPSCQFWQIRSIKHQSPQAVPLPSCAPFSLWKTWIESENGKSSIDPTVTRMTLIIDWSNTVITTWFTCHRSLPPSKLQ